MRNSSLVETLRARGDVHGAIVHALTEYDERASKRRWHNPYAIAMYFEALADAESRIAAGHDALTEYSRRFCDRVLDVVLSAAGLSCPCGHGYYEHRRGPGGGDVCKLCGCNQNRG